MDGDDTPAAMQAAPTSGSGGFPGFGVPSATPAAGQGFGFGAPTGSAFGAPAASGSGGFSFGAPATSSSFGGGSGASTFTGFGAGVFLKTVFNAGRTGSPISWVFCGRLASSMCFVKVLLSMNNVLDRGLFADRVFLGGGLQFCGTGDCRAGIWRACGRGFRLRRWRWRRGLCRRGSWWRRRGLWGRGCWCRGLQWLQWWWRRQQFRRCEQRGWRERVWFCRRRAWAQDCQGSALAFVEKKVVMKGVCDMRRLPGSYK